MVPIVPSSFKRISIYQKLMLAYWGKLDEKISDAEMLVLVWATSQDHKFPGAWLKDSNIKDILKIAFNERAGSGDESATRLLDPLFHEKVVMEALAMRGFANERPSSDNDEYVIRINPDGFLAGEILRDTKHLTSRWRYAFWIGVAWAVVVFGLIVLAGQAIDSLLSFYARLFA